MLLCFFAHLDKYNSSYYTFSPKTTAVGVRDKRAVQESALPFDFQSNWLSQNFVSIMSLQSTSILYFTVSCFQY